MSSFPVPPYTPSQVQTAVAVPINDTNPTRSLTVTDINIRNDLPAVRPAISNPSPPAPAVKLRPEVGKPVAFRLDVDPAGMVYDTYCCNIPEYPGYGDLYQKVADGFGGTLIKLIEKQSRRCQRPAPPVPPPPPPPPYTPPVLPPVFPRYPPNPAAPVFPRYPPNPVVPAAPVLPVSPPTPVVSLPPFPPLPIDPIVPDPVIISPPIYPPTYQTINPVLPPLKGSPGPGFVHRLVQNPLQPPYWVTSPESLPPIPEEAPLPPLPPNCEYKWVRTRLASAGAFNGQAPVAYRTIVCNTSQAPASIPLIPGLWLPPSPPTPPPPPPPPTGVP